MVRLSICLAAMAAALVLASGCATKARKMEALGNGYDKITIARADIPGENEAIKPEFVSEIRKNADIATSLEIYMPRKKGDSGLVDKIVTELRSISGRVPGLVSFNVHSAQDGRVFNYAQFESAGAMAAWYEGGQYRALSKSLEPFYKTADVSTLKVNFIQQ